MPSKQEPHFGVVFGKARLRRRHKLLLNLLKSKADSEMFTLEWGWGGLGGPWTVGPLVPPPAWSPGGSAGGWV